ncbi:hypothetical protein [Rhodococcus sp. NPDC047139]|uniref:hypothetical protein n=1 Tax=Rhodococcus sp. NPDC047139 TaxID=3155141 RepID=UPI0033E7016E
MSRRYCSEDAEFLLEVLDLHPGMSILAIDPEVASSEAVGERVGRGGRVRVAPSAAGAPARCGRHEQFDRIYAMRVPDFRSDVPAVAALAPLLAACGQLWVIDRAGVGEGTGTVSLTVSTVLAQAGFAIVDILERGSQVAVWAAIGHRNHG